MEGVMRALKVDTTSEELLNADSALWRKAETVAIQMFPAPLDMVEERSPFLALSKDHGAIETIKGSALHNTKVLAVRISWEVSTVKDRLDDLDDFVDAVGVMFPLNEDALAMTMGSEDALTNVWYWKAHHTEPYDVLSKGFGSTERRPGSSSKLAVVAKRRGNIWDVIFSRPFQVDGGAEFAGFAPGETTGIAFAAWAGANNERSGMKSISGEFSELVIGV
jgi:DMSO reductase family type II enzyme heme b subunit